MIASFMESSTVHVRMYGVRSRTYIRGVCEKKRYQSTDMLRELEGLGSNISQKKMNSRSFLSNSLHTVH